MPQKFGKILASWSVSERSLAWYIAAGVLGFALFVWAIFTFNYLFALIIVLFSAIVYLRATSDPNIVKFLITTKGVRIGRREYQYKDIDRFWIIYDPPDVKKLYLAFKRSLAPRVMVPLKNQNPVKIREILLDFLFEVLEKEDEPMSEVIGRFAKL